MTLLALMSGVATGQDICVEKIPSPDRSKPLSRKVVEEALDREEYPSALIPEQYLFERRVPTKGIYYDLEGRRYRWNDVDRILIQHPEVLSHWYDRRRFAMNFSRLSAAAPGDPRIPQLRHELAQFTASILCGFNLYQSRGRSDKRVDVELAEVSIVTGQVDRTGPFFTESEEYSLRVPSPTEAPFPLVSVREIGRQKLENGIEIVAVADPGLMTAAVVHRFEVGSASDPEGAGGAAHLVEHLVFETRAGREHGGFLGRVGGISNAHTTWDYTTYESELDAEALDDLLKLERARFSDLAIDGERTNIAKEVVLEELALHTESSAEAYSESLTWSALFGEHAFGHSPGGVAAELVTVDADVASAFFDRWYGPENLRIAVASPYESEAVIAAVAKLYEGMPTGAETPNIARLPKTSNQQEVLALPSTGLGGTGRVYSLDPPCTEVQEASCAREHAVREVFLETLSGSAVDAANERLAAVIHGRGGGYDPRYQSVEATIMARDGLTGGTVLFEIVASPELRAVIREDLASRAMETVHVRGSWLTADAVRGAQNRLRLHGYVLRSSPLAIAMAYADPTTPDPDTLDAALKKVDVSTVLRLSRLFTEDNGRRTTR